ncbi:hypothetical protein GCM10027162_39410 [Streptomyces incanus]
MRDDDGGDRTVPPLPGAASLTGSHVPHERPVDHLTAMERANGSTLIATGSHEGDISLYV